MDTARTYFENRATLILLTLFIVVWNANAIAHHAAEERNTSIWSEPAKSYWYSGQAELSSYRLKQARYGEIHEGTSTLIYVTEPTNPTTQIKADDYTAKDNIHTLKLNATKKFETGLYPYSIMTSVFFPVESRDHALKVTSSVQEWCGHVFTQLNHRESYEIQGFSYFESEGDFALNLTPTHLESELWVKLRIAPSALPQGNISIIPSFEYLRLRHEKVTAYSADAKLTQNEKEYTYTISYPELERELVINFERAFPHKIMSWYESYVSGFGEAASYMTTSAEYIDTLKTDYWNKKRVEDGALREKLRLP